jgi:hypothetical protein
MKGLSLEQRAEKNYHDNVKTILKTLGDIPYITGLNIVPEDDNKVTFKFSVLKYGDTDFKLLVKKIIKGNCEYHAFGYIKILDELITSAGTGEVVDSWGIEINAQGKDSRTRAGLNSQIVSRTTQIIEQYYDNSKVRFQRDVKPGNGKHGSYS